MNQTVNDEAYINFSIRHRRCAARSKRSQQPEQELPAHDAFTRSLHRLSRCRNARERPPGKPSATACCADDWTLDKPYAQKIELVQRHWSASITLSSRAST
ncbi:MAG: hypothetical protein U1F42_01190 [Candidatus Competibacteraceae bacterium]